MVEREERSLTQSRGCERHGAATAPAHYVDLGSSSCGANDLESTRVEAIRYDSRTYSRG